jgi:hypothetical protein
MTIEDQDFNVKFDVVPNDFRAAEFGILGKDFIKDNRIILDLSRNMFMIPSNKTTTTESLIIPPCSICAMSITADESIDHKLVTVKNQEINDNVIIANSVSPVIGNKVISNIINISEEPFIIDQINSSNLDWEPYQEQVLTITKYTGDNKITRVKKLKDLLKTDHLNVEERENLTEPCTDCSDIFFLEGDKLSTTDVIIHSI